MGINGGGGGGGGLGQDLGSRFRVTFSIVANKISDWTM